MGRDTALKNIKNYRYDIDEVTSTIEIWNDDMPNENDAPFLRQPVHPDGRAWVDFVEAEKWATDYIDFLLNPPAPVEEPAPAEIAAPVDQTTNTTK
jgi:hypothetical protein